MHLCSGSKILHTHWDSHNVHWNKACDMSLNYSDRFNYVQITANNYNKNIIMHEMLRVVQLHA